MSLRIRKRVTQHGVVAFTHDEKVRDVREGPGHFTEERDETAVDDNHTVVGVVDHVRQLFGEQANVERVKHCAHRWNREVALEVLLVVPAERADALVGVDTELAQRIGQTAGVGADIGVGDGSGTDLAGLTVERLDGRDLGFGKDLGASAEDGADQ